MASQRPITNGEPLSDDTFERDLKEILEDGPTLNDMHSPVQSGSPNKIMTASFSGTASGNFGTSNSRLTRSYTMPPDEKGKELQDSHDLKKPFNISDLDNVNVVRQATSNVPLSSGSESQGQRQLSGNGDFIPKTMAAANTKLESLKHWSVSTFKCTKQYLSEKLGKGSKTVDLELETQIESLRDMQRKYSNILRLARSLTNHFFQVVQTQRALGEAFSEQAQRSPELQEEFSYNCETQRALVKNGEILLGAMNFFTSTVNTLCNKTMEDTLLTIRNYEAARLEYDAYRNDVEVLQLAQRDSTTVAKTEEAKRKFEAHKTKFEKLRGDVQVKLKFLDENRVKVMHKQLLLFHNAVSAYFSGNDAALEATLKQFNIKLKAPNTDKPSWLEQ